MVFAVTETGISLNIIKLVVVVNKTVEVEDDGTQAKLNEKILAQVPYYQQYSSLGICRQHTIQHLTPTSRHQTFSHNQWIDTTGISSAKCCAFQSRDLNT